MVEVPDEFLAARVAEYNAQARIEGCSDGDMTPGQYLRDLLGDGEDAVRVALPGWPATVTVTVSGREAR